MIVGSLLYYTFSVDNKLLVVLNKLGQQQCATTEATNATMGQLLDYIVMHPNNSIQYSSSIMVLAAHVGDAVKAQSRAGAQLVLSENVPVQSINGPILTIAEIIQRTMSSVAGDEISYLYICAKEAVPIQHTVK